MDGSSPTAVNHIARKWRLRLIIICFVASSALVMGVYRGCKQHSLKDVDNLVTSEEISFAGRSFNVVQVDLRKALAEGLDVCGLRGGLRGHEPLEQFAEVVGSGLAAAAGRATQTA